jgi:hypothetical protein
MLKKFGTKMMEVKRGWRTLHATRYMSCVHQILLE